MARFSRAIVLLISLSSFILPSWRLVAYQTPTASPLELIDVQQRIYNLAWPAGSTLLQYGYDDQSATLISIVFDPSTHTVSHNSKIVPKVLRPSEQKMFGIGTNPYSISPDERFVVYVSEKTRNFVIVDRTRTLAKDTEVFATNIREFDIIWNTTSTAFLPLNGFDTTNTAFFSGFERDVNATKVTGLTYQATGDLPFDITQFKKNIFQISDNATSFLMRGYIQDQLVSVNINSLSQSKIIFTGEVKAASYYSGGTDQVLAVTKAGLMLIATQTGSKTVIDATITTEWAEEARFSPDGNWLALTHDDGLGTVTLYMLNTRKAVGANSKQDGTINWCVMLTLVAMADTHLFHADLVIPDGDILIHAGDLSRNGSLTELTVVRDFLAALPHRIKIIVAGNHDRAFEEQPEAARALFQDFIYLQDESRVLEGIHFYGSPWTPAYNDWAFNLPRGKALAEKWALIPEHTDILITHGPPFGIGDSSPIPGREGCIDLGARVQRIAPKLHLFGHIHQARGRWQIGGTTFINVTTDECLQPVTVVRYGS